MGEAVDKDLVIQGLIESTDVLQETANRYRNNNRVLRTVIRALRESNKTLLEQIEIAKQNDEIFKSYCQGEFDVKTSPAVEAGLAETAGTVEPLG